MDAKHQILLYQIRQRVFDFLLRKFIHKFFHKRCFLYCVPRDANHFRLGSRQMIQRLAGDQARVEDFTMSPLSFINSSCGVSRHSSVSS